MNHGSTSFRVCPYPPRLHSLLLPFRSTRCASCILEARIVSATPETDPGAARWFLVTPQNTSSARPTDAAGYLALAQPRLGSRAERRGCLDLAAQPRSRAVTAAKGRSWSSSRRGPRQLLPNYDIAWARFDVLLFAALASTAASALRRARCLANAASWSAALLATDA
jgi:hypothetical protein